MMNLMIEQSDTHIELPTQTLVAFSAQEAYAGITLLAIAFDTDLADEELGAIDRQLAQMHLFQHFQPQTMHRMYQKLFTILQRDGEEVLLASVRETLPSELREAAFASASDLVFADGMISPDESSFLMRLSQALEIPMATAISILGGTHLECSYNHALSNV